MLDGIDKVNWSQLTHAYGSAEDVPELIRALADPDKEVRESALWNLYGNIFHQGTRYSATPHAVPFLYELLADARTPDRQEIVGLLVNLALGYEDAYLPDGLRVESFRDELQRFDAELSAEQRAECEEFGFGPLVDLRCHDAVDQGVGALLPLLEGEDRRLGRAVVHALAWFPGHAERSVPAIQRFLAGASEDLDVASALLALGLLARSCGAAVDRRSLRGFLQVDSFLVRVAAAIALATETLDDEVTEVLVGAIQCTEELDGQGEGIRFNEGNLAGYESLVLASGGGAARQRIVAALCEALASVNAYQSLDVTRSLLHLVVGRRQQPISDTPATSLEPLERTALQAIADHGGWKMDDAVFVNYCELVRAHGLPDSQEALKKYLETDQ